MTSLLACLALAAPPTADFAITGGTIWTGEPAQPAASAIASFKGRILAVGSDADIKALMGPKTVVVDAAGRRVVPGFIDSHAHVLGGGIQLGRVELKDAANEAEFGKRLREFDEKTPRDRWLLGGNWDHDRTFNGVLPTAALLDKYVKNRPVFIRRYDGHMAVCNSAALRIAGIESGTKDPAGGVIERDAEGRPTGALKDNAMDLVDKHVPEPDAAEIAEGTRAALQYAARVGITGIQDMEGHEGATKREYIRLLQRMNQAGTLTCRLHVRWPIAAFKELANLGVRANFGGDFLRIGGLKGFMDGSLGSSTGMMFEPYANDPKTSGVFVTPPGVMKAWVKQADAAGLNVCVHAIGDRANAELLDIFEAVTSENGPGDRRFRIEHAQHLRPRDYARFRKGHVIASMQPFHVADDGRWAEGRIGAQRCESSYAFRSLLDAGAVLAFGSDWPVAPLDPLLGIDAAVNRTTLDGKHPNGWIPSQKITVEEAVKAYTWGSAYGGGQESDLGTLAVGKWCDLVVLDRDIFDPREKSTIGKSKVACTIVGGKVVFSQTATK